MLGNGTLPHERYVLSILGSLTLPDGLVVARVELPGAVAKERPRRCEREGDSTR